MSGDTADPGRPNKSARKREMAALHALADKMLALSDTELARLGVAGDLRAALQQARVMRPSGARNRQLKHCVKLMDGEDLVEVTAYLDNRQAAQLAANRALHALERWRERLIEQGDDALGVLLDENPGLDRQRLRQLMRDARREREHGKPAGAERKLFRFLRDGLDRDNTQKN